MASYGTQGTAWENYSPKWTSGSGLYMHHQGDTDYLKEAGWFLDKDTEWKTKWNFKQGSTGGGNSLQNAHNWGMTGGYQGWDGSRDRWARKDPGDRAAYTTGNWQKAYAGGVGPMHKGSHTGLRGMALEQLDWDAYDKDIHYKTWLKATGKDQFKTLQDIKDAEAYIAGGAITGERHRNELAELKAQLEAEQLKNQQWQAQNTPQHIDTPGAEATVGGIWDTPTGQAQMQQMQDWQSQMSAWNQQNQAQQTAQQAQMAAWNQQNQSQMDAWGSQMGGWGNQMGGWGGQMSQHGDTINQYGNQVQGFGDKQNAWLNAMEQQKISQMFGPRQGAYGVHSGKALQPYARRTWGPSGAFNRQGMRISNLNI